MKRLQLLGLALLATIALGGCAEVGIPLGLISTYRATHPSCAPSRPTTQPTSTGQPTVQSY